MAVPYVQSVDAGCRCRGRLDKRLSRRQILNCLGPRLPLTTHGSLASLDGTDGSRGQLGVRSAEPESDLHAGILESTSKALRGLAPGLMRQGQLEAVLPAQSENPRQ